MERWPLSERGKEVLNVIIGDQETIEGAAYELSLLADRGSVIELLDNIDGEELKEIIDKYLLGGGSVKLDPDLLYALRPYLLIHNPNVVEAEVAMESNPHALIYTNPYVGKSTTFDKIGKKYDYCKPAKVLGWSSADRNEKGALDELTQAFGMDEINESDHKEGFLKRGYLPLMRNGNYEAAQGQGVKTETWSPLVFMSNPKDSENSKELIFKFRSNLSNLSDNYGALGSRIGLVMYGTDYKTVEQFNGNKIRGEKAEKVVKTVIDVASTHFGKVLKSEEIQDWLNKDFPQGYEEFIEERAEHDIELSEVGKFWLEHLKASKHARGHALRNAFLDHLPDPVHDVHDVQEIIDSANQHFEELIRINKESLKEICTSIEDDAVKKMKEDRLYNLEPKYMRLFTYAVLDEVDNPDEFKEFKPLGNLKQTYLVNKDEYLDENTHTQYAKFAVIKNKVENSNNQKRENFESKIGIEVQDIEGVTMWRISDESRFRQFSEIF